MIYRGIGGSWAPHAPLVEALISDALRARGLIGVLSGPECRFGSTMLSQARSYTFDEASRDIRILTLLPGSSISRAEGHQDLLMSLEVHLKGLFWEGMESAEVLTDSRGDLGTINEWLRGGAPEAREDMRCLVDEFLAEVEIRELHIGKDADPQLLQAFLEGHEGEVWVNGPVAEHPYETADPELAPTF